MPKSRLKSLAADDSQGMLQPMRAGSEHEVVDNQLSAPFEQIRETNVSLRAVEDVRLLDSDHRLPAALGGKSVASARRGLLLRHERIMRAAPFGLRNDRGKDERLGRETFASHGFLLQFGAMACCSSAMSSFFMVSTARMRRSAALASWL